MGLKELPASTSFKLLQKVLLFNRVGIDVERLFNKVRHKIKILDGTVLKICKITFLEPITKV